nr:glycosyltransferase family 2 protein [Propionibacterium sp.]
MTGPTPQPVVSVIIPCHNAAATLPLQLEALATQTGAPPFEVVVVDNRSTDNTTGIVDEWATRVPFRLRLVRAGDFQGASYARNVGVRESTAELLMFCDADDAVSEFWVDHGRRCFDVSPVWSGSALSLEDAAFERSLPGIRQAIGDDPAWVAPVFAQENAAFPILMGGNFGATKAAMLSVGGFDQSLPSAGEDNDLGFRFRRSGYSVPVALTVRIAYRGKWDLATRRHLTFRSALAHALIATRYAVWPQSPYPHWLIEVLRCAGAGLKFSLRPRHANWTGWTLRTTSALGIAAGTVHYRFLRRVPEAQLGVGFTTNSDPERRVRA